jgi:hypothetical protein
MENKSLENINQYGCVVFDDEHSHSAGFAAKEGERAKRIASTANLESDVTWMTNLGYGVSGSSGFSGHSRFRREDFLRKKIKNIADGVGLTEKALDEGHHLLREFVLSRKVGETVSAADFPAMLSIVTSQIFANTSRIGAVISGYDFNHLSKYNLGLREVSHPIDPELPEYVADALRSAFLAWVTCERNASAGHPKAMMFKLQPVAHSINMLNIPIPTGKWHRETNANKGRDIIASRKHPFLVNVSVTDIHPDLNRLINFGSRGGFSGGRGTRHNRAVSVRKWITDVELDVLAQFSNIKVKEVMYCDAVTDYDWIQEIRSVLQLLEDKLVLSVSGGLFAENVWTGVAAKYRPDRLVNSNNTVSPFIYAMDRSACFVAAIKLMGEGFQVNGYGSGQIRVEYEEDLVDMDAAADAAVKHGLMPPSGITSSLEAADLSTPLGIMQSLTAVGDTGKLLDVDNKVADTISKRLGGNINGKQ